MSMEAGRCPIRHRRYGSEYEEPAYLYLCGDLAAPTQGRVGRQRGLLGFAFDELLTARFTTSFRERHQSLRGRSHHKPKCVDAAEPKFWQHRVHHEWQQVHLQRVHATVEKRFAKGGLMTATYTRSSSWDYGQQYPDRTHLAVLAAFGI